jgi:hypothetical protein
MVLVEERRKLGRKRRELASHRLIDRY